MPAESWRVPTRIYLQFTEPPRMKYEICSISPSLKKVKYEIHMYYTEPPRVKCETYNYAGGRNVHVSLSVSVRGRV